MSDKDPIFQMISQGIRQNNIDADKKIEQIRQILDNDVIEDKVIAGVFG